MKTIITQNIDGYDVIIQIDDAAKLIDPVATQAVVNKKILKNDVYKKIDELKNQMQILANQAMQAMRNTQRATNQAEKDSYVKEYQNRNAQIEDIQEQLKPLAVEIENIYRMAMLENAVYFTPAPYEIIISDEDGDKATSLMIEATQEGAVVDKNMKKIPDNRGQNFWKKSGGSWIKTEIIKLGDVPPKGAIQDKDLTADQQTEIMAQLETDRISKLSSKDKAAELDNVIAGLKMQAVQMRSSLEIDGDKNALQKAQDWLAEAMDDAEKKYA